jgi:apolipoprotein D and lipocalin family protein
MRLKTTIAIGGALLVAAAAYAAAGPNAAPLTTVASVELSRYLGRWYEIARYPNWFQKKCAGDTTATYSLLDDGRVGVLNECRKADGSKDEAKGKAKVADTATNAKLRVTFFWPFYGDYWVIGLDPAYRWAVVGEPGRKYLWVLSRTPQMADADYEDALRVVREKGYDPSRLVKTPHSAGGL